MKCDLDRRQYRLLAAKTVTCLALAAELCALPGCGGGSGVNKGIASGDSTYVPPVQQPPLEFPLVSLFECDSPPTEPTTQEDTAPGGVFSEFLFDCSLGIDIGVVMLIADDGRFVMIRTPWDGPTHEQPLTGALTARGNTFNGTGVDFGVTGNDSASSHTGALAIDGIFTDPRRLDGRWRIDDGGYGYFALARIEVYPPQGEVTLTDVIDIATAVGPNQYAEETSWTIEADGSFTGQDSRGCDHTGLFSLSGPRSLVLQVQVTLTGCARAGNYTGLATKLPYGGFGEKLVVAVDDGDRQALSLDLYYQD